MGIEKLSRDLDIVNLLDMIKGYQVMKQVLFNQDERFLLHLQRRDMIDTTDTDPDQEFKMQFKMSSQAERSRSRYVFNALQRKLGSAVQSGEDFLVEEEQRESVRKLLKRFENRKLENQEFRILQGVL